MEPQQIILEVTQELLSRAGFAVEITWAEDPLLRLCISSSDNLTPLIGTTGQHLQSLEHLLRLVVVHRLSGCTMPDFFLDISDYRKAHFNHLWLLADAAAQRVLVSGHAEALVPMNAQERKIIHTKLSSYVSLETRSVGIEPNRRIIIKAASL